VGKERAEEVEGVEKLRRLVQILARNERALAEGVAEADGVEYILRIVRPEPPLPLPFELV